MSAHERAMTTIQTLKRIDASPEWVFDEFMNGQVNCDFLFGDGRSATRNWGVLSHSGGGFAIVGRRDGSMSEHYGEYLEIERPHLLVYTLTDFEHSSRDGRIIAEFRAHLGGCMIELHHVCVLARHAQVLQKRWADALQRLESSVLARRETSPSL